MEKYIEEDIFLIYIYTEIYIFLYTHTHTHTHTHYSLCSAGKESACNERDLGLIPELGRSPGEEKSTHSNILAWRIPWAV